MWIGASHWPGMAKANHNVHSPESDPQPGPLSVSANVFFRGCDILSRGRSGPALREQVPAPSCRRAGRYSSHLSALEKLKRAASGEEGQDRPWVCRCRNIRQSNNRSLEVLPHADPGHGVPGPPRAVRLHRPFQPVWCHTKHGKRQHTNWDKIPRPPGSVRPSSPSIVMQASCHPWLTPLTDSQPSPSPGMSQSHSMPC